MTPREAVSLVAFKASQLRSEATASLAVCPSPRLTRWLERVAREAGEIEDTGRLIVDVLEATPPEDKPPA